MPERLTESLIRRGVLNQAQADEAMERQVLQGGALDTSLLELELVDEVEVIDALSAAYGLTSATVDQAGQPTDARAVRSFPEQWAKKHMLAPLTLDPAQKVLSVLTPAPADLNLIGRLGELLELTIEPLLAPEFRVSERLALLYEAAPHERLQPLIERFGGAVPAPATLAPEAPSTPEPRDLSPLSFGSAVNALRDARHRDDIAETSLRYAIKDLEMVALFIVHSDHVEGWMGIGPSAEKVPKLPIPLKSDSAFRVVLDTQAHYLGPLPSDPLHVEFLESLGRPEPRAVLIVPIRIRSRTVALLYGENGAQTIAPRLAADLMLFTTHVQGALESLLIRKKAESITDLSERPQPADLPKSIKIERKVFTTEEDEETPPMSEVRGGESTEYAYVRSKANGEAEAVDGSMPEDDIDIEISETIEEPVLGSSTPEAAMDALAQAEAAETLPDEADEEGWDSVDIEPSSDISVLASKPAEPAEPEDEEGWDSVDIEPSSDISVLASKPAEPADVDEPLASPAGLPTEETPVPVASDTLSGSIMSIRGDDDEAPGPSAEAYQSAVLAEMHDGGALLDELESLTEPSDEAVTGDLEEGWDEVQVDTWEEFGQKSLAEEVSSEPDPEDRTEPSSETEKWIEKGYQELKAMRESLGEDATVPDLSAEAWIRASSDVTRARPLPPEVMERAARPAEAGAAQFRTIVQANQVPPTIVGEPADPIMGQPLEPVPLTQRTTASYAARGIDAPLESDDVRHHHEHLVDNQGQVVPARDEPEPADEPPPKSPLEQLLEQVMSANREERMQAAADLRSMGPDILPQLSEVFPGITDVDPFSNPSGLPPFAECGVLCEVFAQYGAEAHRHVAPRLDAKEPLRRFFAVYYYSAVFVPEVIPRLIQRLHDEESRICMLAARTLFMYREHPDFEKVLDHLHGRLEATSVTARRHAAYLIGLFRDVTAIPKLIEAFDRKEKAMFEVTEDALAEITKQRFGPSPKKWKTWWSKNQERSRIEWLIEGLTSKDAALRKSSAEELRAVTGLHMGYDEGAPKRQREESRKRWVDWWQNRAQA